MSAHPCATIREHIDGTLSAIDAHEHMRPSELHLQ